MYLTKFLGFLKTSRELLHVLRNSQTLKTVWGHLVSLTKLVGLCKGT
jgi:hypothetical protein